MRISAFACPRTVSIFHLFLLFFILTSTTAAAWPQSAESGPYFARKNTFSVFGAYSNDSSHILLGDAENRKLLDLGAAYARRLFLNHIVNWQYSGEVLPIALESDPTASETISQTEPTQSTRTGGIGAALLSCVPVSTAYSFTEANGTPVAYTITQFCSGRRWTVGEGISPVGFQWNFLPRRKLQPFFIGHGGYMYSTQPIPITQAGAFNFTFDLGAGFELYRSKHRSVRAEYRYHHISNHDTAVTNPGIDSGLFQLTYSFGR